MRVLEIPALNELRKACTEMLRNGQAAGTVRVDIDPAAVGLEFLYGATDSLDQFSMLLPPEKTGGPSVGLRDSLVGIGAFVAAGIDRCGYVEVRCSRRNRII